MLFKRFLNSALLHPKQVLEKILLLKVFYLFNLLFFKENFVSEIVIIGLASFFKILGLICYLIVVFFFIVTGRLLNIFKLLDLSCLRFMLFCIFLFSFSLFFYFLFVFRLLQSNHFVFIKFFPLLYVLLA